jgi:fatty-acyl-CoA synthase
MTAVATDSTIETAQETDMKQSQLTPIPLLERAGTFFRHVEISSRRPDNSIHRYTYGDLYRRARMLAAALQDRGLRPGDRVATLMWNHHMHLETFFGVQVVGGVVHALNPNLYPDDLAHIVNHANDRFLIVDDALLPVFGTIKSRVNLEHVIVAPFGGTVAHCYEDYEAMLRGGGGDPTYANLLEEDAAVIGYISGTTGKPKGVVYSHREIALHSYSISPPAHVSNRRRDTMLPAMSMGHADAWGLPYAAVMSGASLIFPGSHLQPEQILDLLSNHQVTLAGAAPTVWLGVIDVLERRPDRWHFADGARVIVTGSAVPDTLCLRFDRFGIRVTHAWGLEDTTPIATVFTFTPAGPRRSADERYEPAPTHGLPSPFMQAEPDAVR